jgi:hypothetical protein
MDVAGYILPLGGRRCLWRLQKLPDVCVGCSMIDEERAP